MCLVAHVMSSIYPTYFYLGWLRLVKQHGKTSFLAPTTMAVFHPGPVKNGLSQTHLRSIAQCAAKLGTEWSSKHRQWFIGVTVSHGTRRIGRIVLD